MVKTLAVRLGVGARSLKSSQKAGFTLAEVLITLAIIGVVAALTIPVLVGKYQKHQLYTQFIKVYNTLQTAYSLSVAQNGDPDSWSIGSLNDGDAFKKYLGTYLNVTQYCNESNAAACGIDESTSEIGFLYPPSNFTVDEDTLLGMMEDYDTAAVLGDGSLIIIRDFSPQSDYTLIHVDVNGAKKGPNKRGRDIYQFLMNNKTPSGEYGIYPEGLYQVNGKDITYSTAEDIINLQNDNSCRTSGNKSFGFGCGARLLLEGKMNY